MINTYCARYYLRMMVKATELCGHDVLYGDTDSILIQFGNDTEDKCIESTLLVRKKTYIRDNVLDCIPRGRRGRKGNHKLIIISAKKKHERLS